LFNFDFMFTLLACVAKRTLAAYGCQTGITAPITHNFPTAGIEACHFLIRKWHWQEADRTIIFGRWLFEQGLVMDFGGALLAFFFVAGPVPPLTRHAAILDVLARIARLEASTTLATLGTMRHCIWVGHGIF
jgi:hypothetical protein